MSPTPQPPLGPVNLAADLRTCRQRSKDLSVFEQRFVDALIANSATSMGDMYILNTIAERLRELSRDAAYGETSGGMSDNVLPFRRPSCWSARNR